MIGGDFSPNLDPISDKKKIYEKKITFQCFYISSLSHRFITKFTKILYQEDT